MSIPPQSTEGKKANVAVVGLGFMGVTHLRAHLDNPASRVVAVCDATRVPVDGILPGVAGNIKKSDGIPLGPDVKIFRKFDELLADPEVEIVDLCTPTPLHPEQAIAALEAGKHVLCEKPLARTSAEAAKILEAAAVSSGMLMPAMCMRFWPGWSRLKQVVEEQTYGKVLAAGFRRLSEMPAWSRQGTYAGADPGGALFDLHIHDSDFVHFLFGRPADVYSTGVTGQNGSINHVVTQYNFPGGPAVFAEGSWLLKQGFHMGYTLYCERATLDFDPARGAEAMHIREQGKPATIVKLDGPDGYGEEIRYFVDCVVKGTPPTLVTAMDGLTALEICEAEEASVRTGQVIAL